MNKSIVILTALAVIFALSAAASAAESAAPKNEATAAIEEILAGNKAEAQNEADKRDTAKPEVNPSPTQPAPVQKPTAQPALPKATLRGRPLAQSPMAAGAPETRESLLVSVDWLKKNINSIVLIDTRPDSMYKTGHLPGAVNATWTYFANMNAPTGSMKYGTVWPPATMAKRLGALGIGGKKMIVTYCDCAGWGQSGWVLWILRMSGIKNARILDGGYLAWEKSGGRISVKPHKNKAVPFAIKSYNPEYVVDTKWINDNVGKPGLVLLDVRTEPEFLGKIRPFQEKRAGHLPGAINIPLSEYIKKDYTFLDRDEIATLLAKHNITPDNEIVVYDTLGVRAAFVTMALRYAGFLKSRCYDQGFQAWAGRKDLPLIAH